MTDQTASQLKADPNGLKLAWLWLVPGVTKTHCFSLFFAAFTTIGLVAFITVGTNYILNTNLNIPTSEHGRINGDLHVLSEIVQILMFSTVGVLADRIGRRPVYALGLVGMGLGYFFYPMAESLTDLTVYRFIYAFGLAASTGMLGTVIADYPQEVSRGKLVATVGVLNGLGVLAISVGFSGVPSLFVDAGYDPITAGRYTHWLLVAIALTTALVAWLGLKPGTPTKKEEQPDIKHLIKAGFLEGRKPRIALAYASAFVARSDLVIVGTFVVTWGSVAAIDAGLSEAEASARGGMLFGIVQTAALLWSPVIGLLLDKINRVTGIAVCMGLAAIGFSSTAFITDPLSPSAIPFFLLLGVGQVSAFFGATTIIGQEAPTAERGAVVGMFNMMGAVGILVASSAGGRMFDSVAPSAPFVLIGSINTCIFIAALIIRQKSPGYIPDILGKKVRALRQRDQIDSVESGYRGSNPPDERQQ